MPCLLAVPSLLYYFTQHIYTVYEHKVVNRHFHVMYRCCVGLKGLVVAVMLSAVVSSLTSSYNSLATVFAMDIWAKLKTKASQRELLMVGR